MLCSVCLNAWCSCSSITCHTHILQTATRHNFQAAGEENHHTDAEVLCLDDEDAISPPAIQPIPLDDAEAAAIVIEMSLQVPSLFNYAFDCSRSLALCLCIATRALLRSSFLQAARALQKLVLALPLGKSSGGVFVWL